MIISHKYRYIFIKVSKTAGTSIQHALWRHHGPEDICTGVPASRKKGALSSHATAQQIRRTYPQIWNNYFKFGYVRNPWDRVVSYYCMHANINWDDNFSTIRNTFTKKIQQLFKKAARTHTPNTSLFNLFSPFTQIALNNKIAIDCVCRFETLNNDFKNVCEHLNIPYTGLRKTRNNTRVDKRHYSQWYNNDTKNIIATHFSKTITTFEYTFDDRR